jgi:hypothetical protein
LGWAFRDGQFDNFDRGAKSIFGPDEPVGEATDAFPGMRLENDDQAPELMSKSFSGGPAGAAAKR